MSNFTRLLIVEDDEVDRIRLKRAFRSRQHEVKFEMATTLDGAKRLLAQEVFDCALLDLHLPDGNALDLIGNLGSIPAVILTGLEDDAVSKDALARGAQDYINKADISERSIWRSIRYAMERKNAEGLRTRLQQTDRLAALGRVAASVAHEINNPNAFIAANLQLLKNETRRWQTLFQALQQRADIDPSLAHILREHDAVELGEDLDELVDDCLEGVRRVTGLVRQMQTFSRQDGEETPALTDVNEVIEQTLSLLRVQAGGMVGCEVELDTNAPLCLARQSRLVQVMTNVIDNARQAARANENVRPPMIAVRTTFLPPPLEGVRITVDDSGKGIPKKLRTKVLDPFFTTKPVGEGTGLGLSIVREIVEQHWGDLTLGDGPLGGARIQIDLPVGVIPTDTVESEESSDSELTTACRLLIIDDESSVLRALRRLLVPHNIICASGTEALQVLETDHDFDAIICDVMMPDVDGVTIFEHLEAHLPQLAARVIFHTGGAVSVRGSSLLARIQNPVLEKPATRHEFIRAIISVVNDSTAERTTSESRIDILN